MYVVISVVRSQQMLTFSIDSDSTRTLPVSE